MGGRGGTPAAGHTVGGSSTQGQEFRQWLANPRPLNADMVDDPAIKNKVILNLPDRGAYIDRSDRAKPVVRDTGTDETLFRGRSDIDLYQQMSAYYGVQVEYNNERTGATKMYGTRGNPRTSPAAKRYGVK